jgi:hypothetical protein
MRIYSAATLSQLNPIQPTLHFNTILRQKYENYDLLEILLCTPDLSFVKYDLFIYFMNSEKNHMCNAAESDSLSAEAGHKECG